MIKVIVMDKLREQYPEKFNESGAMDYKWFEADIRPNYNCFIRLDVSSLAFSFDVANARLTLRDVNTFLKTFSFDNYKE